MGPVVRPVGAEEREWMESRLERLFGGDVVVSRGRVHRPPELPGFVALTGGERVGLATYDVRDGQCELVTLDALLQWRGIGTALLAAVEEHARAAGCARLWLITTNDNVDALRFYQRRGFGLAAVHPGAIRESRRLKPSIPAVGHYGIPLTDEIELEKAL
ncbi:MAG: GNAT family N-acetyltransferase [Planctomycetota bacterium]|jgi:GNAT superfamily N-acetyltransferase